MSSKRWFIYVFYSGLFQCLCELKDVLPPIEENYELAVSVARHVWVACNDPEAAIQQIAQR